MDTLVAIWHTEDVVELFDYVKSTRATARPLRLAGMDMSFASTFEEEQRPGLLRDLVAKIDPAYAERYGAQFAMVSLLMNRGQAADGLRAIYSVSPAAAWSIEGLLHASGTAVAFLDLAGAPPAPERAWIDQEFVFRDFGLEDIHAIPCEQMDGVLFLESVDPPAFVDP